LDISKETGFFSIKIHFEAQRKMAKNHNIQVQLPASTTTKSFLSKSKTAFLIAIKNALFLIISEAQNKASFVDNFQKVFVKLSCFWMLFKKYVILFCIS
jgi:hypothetical protein